MLEDLLQHTISGTDNHQPGLLRTGTSTSAIVLPGQYRRGDREPAQRLCPVRPHHNSCQKHSQECCTVFRRHSERCLAPGPPSDDPQVCSPPSREDLAQPASTQWPTFSTSFLTLRLATGAMSSADSAAAWCTCSTASNLSKSLAVCCMAHAPVNPPILLIPRRHSILENVSPGADYCMPRRGCCTCLSLRQRSRGLMMWRFIT
jgi:hypothetical protein